MSTFYEARSRFGKHLVFAPGAGAAADAVFAMFDEPGLAVQVQPVAAPVAATVFLDARNGSPTWRQLGAEAAA